MIDFKQRFAEYNAATGEYVFSNVRNGLIVGLVRPIPTCKSYLY
jgi:SP family sugar:H+ symporter-like MFS transporter